MQTHRFDPVSLVGGLVFVAVALVALLDTVVLTVDDLRWIGPALLVVFGVGLVLGGARGRRAEDEPRVEHTEVTPGVEDTGATPGAANAWESTDATAASDTPDTAR